MNRLVALGGLIGFAIGIFVGATVSGRYEFAKISDYPAKFDRWTGNAEIIFPKVSPEWKKAMAGKSSPAPTADVWWKKDPAVMPTP